MADHERIGHPPTHMNDDQRPIEAAHREQPASATNSSDTAAHIQPGGSSTQSSMPSQNPRVIGGFAAMVDAFMSSFRQASVAQTRMSHSEQQQDGPSQPVLHSSMQPRQASADSSPPQTISSANTSQGPAVSQQDNIRPQEGESSAQSSATPVEAMSQQENISSSIPADTTTAPPDTLEQSNDTITAQPAGESDTPRILYFRMPFLTNDGSMATLAFQPGPIPIPPQPTGPAPTYGPERPEHFGPERGNGRASGFHLPAAPIFVPLGASPLPFSFIFDTQTNTAWPIAAMSTGPPGAMQPTSDENGAGFVAGPPFHVALNISFVPPPQPEAPDPERAMRFVDSLEVADAELRKRMARLSLGSIGDYGGRQDNEGAEGALGCGICLDEYPSEDRPEWIGGQASRDEEVVAVPCAGHHTLHRRCLYEWLAKSPPSEWTCPFCRAGLDKKKVDESSNTATNRPQQSNAVPSDDLLKKAEQEAKARSLREEVRLKEKARGWRCDSPACLPRYPNQESDITFSQTLSNRMVSLLPCRHKQHFDCLCTSMRVEQADSAECTDEEEEDYEDAEEVIETTKDDRDNSNDVVEDVVANDTVGKWVTCPTCRHEAWAELPMRRKSRRVAAAQAKSNSIVLLSPDTSSHSVSRSGSCASSPNLGSKRALEAPTSGARERARLLDLQRASRDEVDGDSDRDVEAILL